MDDAATVADLHESAGARPTGLLAVNGTRKPTRKEATSHRSSTEVGPAFKELTTTRKPRPYSPAFSASIAALSDSRLVWSATRVIVVTTWVMLPAFSFNQGEDASAVGLLSLPHTSVVYAHAGKPAQLTAHGQS